LGFCDAQGHALRFLVFDTCAVVFLVPAFFSSEFQLSGSPLSAPAAEFLVLILTFLTKAGRAFGLYLSIFWCVLLWCLALLET